MCGCSKLERQVFFSSFFSPHFFFTFPSSLPLSSLSLSPHPHETRFETTLLYLKMATGRSELFWKEVRSEEKETRCDELSIDPSNGSFLVLSQFSTSREEEGRERENHLHTKVIITI